MNMDNFLICLHIILGLIAIKYVYDIKTYLNKINDNSEMKSNLRQKFKLPEQNNIKKRGQKSAPFTFKKLNSY